MAESLKAVQGCASGGVDLDIVFGCPQAHELNRAGSDSPAKRVERFRFEVLEGGAARFRRLGVEVEADAESPMFAGPLPAVQPLAWREEGEWMEVQSRGSSRLRIRTRRTPPPAWSDLIPPGTSKLEMKFSPDGEHWVSLSAYDQFLPHLVDTVGLGFLEIDGEVTRSYFALHAGNTEKFCGTGERFARMNLAGQTMHLVNQDALGVNSRRAYKNIPFYMSSSGYGLFVHSSAAMTFSLAHHSTRSAATMVEGDGMDVFLFSGTPEKILSEYRRVTGKPPGLPRWTYGIWMARMTYFSAEEIREVGDRLRRENFPADVIHIDTGWFRKDWKCEWAFSEERFPDPAAFAREMLDRGFRMSLWQTPKISKGTLRYDEAVEKGYLAPVRERKGADSNFSGGRDQSGCIDFSNPEAVVWYQGLLKELLDMGYAAIKTDFGEEIGENADYRGLPYSLLRNRYALLYQQAAFEITRQVKGQGIIWARSAWAGAQQYPVHWAGDAAATWDGMAGCLRGGLHLGMSGFAYWSHDVPGFHGIPDFMNSGPEDDLYVRWTQFGVFSSHLRYHGTSPREPWFWSADTQDLVRRWWRLRYALIPYIERECRAAVESGRPFLSSLLLAHPEDPTCWEIDDQFYAGRDLLVAPVMNPEGCRDVYLPEGEWIDFWSGEAREGGCWLLKQTYPLDTCPVYVRKGAVLPVYPHAVAHTGEMVDAEIREHLITGDELSSSPAECLGFKTDAV
ncbi:MAG: glycoside hydrolase family 31 protein [Verrucomicrobia bacterium]|nr:glycoside hydrolase family 31 protein [Verrucomicrobiota bacterium]MCH8527471.1 alpha-xylosidase [Kiritimatiellia bacterium]